MQFIKTLDQIDSGDRGLVGGKALGQARLAKAGFAVPPAFCITTIAHQSWIDNGRRIEAGLAHAILTARAGLLSPELAIRSSLAIEDSSLTSLAGLTKTQLGQFSDTALLEVIEELWAQTDSGIVSGYLEELGLKVGELAVAILVQVLVPADVAGVLMTRDPLQSSSRRFVVEAAWGLGESVVSGEVVPDRYWLDPLSGKLADQQLGFKPVRRSSGGREAVAEQLQRASCLTSDDLIELAACGRSVANLFGAECDIEWAKVALTLWILQARPITTANDSEQAEIRREEIRRARDKAEPGGTIWIRDAFAQELPEPTPMTWSVLKIMLSARGGYGLMYRDLGFHPEPDLDESGSYDLICGRLYCNLGREPHFYADGLPLTHDLEVLRQGSQETLASRPKLDLSHAGPQFWFRLPWHLYRTMMMPTRLQRACKTFLATFRTQTITHLQNELESVKNNDWSRCDESWLLDALHKWIDLVLREFAKEALKAGVLASHAESSITNRLRKMHSAEAAHAYLTEFAGDLPVEPEVDLIAALRALASGSLELQAFLARFGHRCGGEWELARRRWSETSPTIHDLAIPAEIVLKRVESRREVPDIVAEEVEVFRELLCLRELAKHYLLAGYGVIRQILLEWDRRHALDGGSFFLTLETLFAGLPDEELKRISACSRRHRRLQLGLAIPARLDSEDLEAIGRPVRRNMSIGRLLTGIPLSPGDAEGIAFQPKDPRREKAPSEPFVLVCTCTDPAWIPLASQARGLVTETGGLLSHGAILARELGLPAVGGVTDACSRLPTGVLVRVDGSKGLVTIVS